MSKSESLAQKYAVNLAQTVGHRPHISPPGHGAVMAQPADKYAGAVKSRAFAELAVDDVDRDETQPREEFDDDDLRRLAASIAKFGQLSPIRVRHDASRGRWVVLVGERRLRACKLAGLERVRVEFVEREMTQADILAEQTVENMVRAPLSPVEQGRAYRRLMDLRGWTAVELAETIGVEETSVYRSLALLRLPDDVAERVDSGEIKATAAYEIAKLQIADDQRAVADAVVSGGLDHKETVKAVARRRAAAKGGGGKGRGGVKLPTARVVRTADGFKVTVEHRRGISPAAWLAALDDAAAKVREDVAGAE